MPTQHKQVSEHQLGMRLDQVATELFDLSRNQVGNFIKSGTMRVNNKRSKASYLVRTGDKITFESVISVPDTMVFTLNLPVVYEDDDLMVIEKPAGISMHPVSGRKQREATIADFARAHTTDPDLERPGIVHRLDKDTSGLVIIAKTLDAKSYLQGEFANRRVHKTYLALIGGHPDSDEAVINLPISRSHRSAAEHEVKSGGRESQTAYKVTEKLPNHTLLEAEPKTGRTHQLRVHFQAIGHPIVGDTLYAKQQPAWATRQFLHAIKLSFIGPHGQSVSVTSEMPEDLGKALAHARAI